MREIYKSTWILHILTCWGEHQQLQQQKKKWLKQLQLRAQRFHFNMKIKLIVFASVAASWKTWDYPHQRRCHCDTSAAIHTFNATCDTERIYQSDNDAAGNCFFIVESIHFFRYSLSLTFVIFHIENSFRLTRAQAHSHTSDVCSSICAANANESNSIESVKSQVAHKSERFRCFARSPFSTAKMKWNVK